MCVQGAVTKSSLDNTTTSKMAGLVKGITNQARSVVRDLDPVNELAFLRLRSTKTEFLIAPGGQSAKNLCLFLFWCIKGRWLFWIAKGFFVLSYINFQTRIMF